MSVRITSLGDKQGTGMNHRKELALLKKILERGSILESSWPELMHSNLRTLKVIGALDSGLMRGKRAPQIWIKDRNQLDKRIAWLTPEEPDNTRSVRGASVMSANDSKSGDALPYLILNLVGGKDVSWRLDNDDFYWPHHPHPSCIRSLVIDQRGPGSSPTPVGPVILVENLDVQMNIGQKLPESLQGALIIHYPGWVSDKLIQALQSWDQADIYISPDLDPVGLSNLMRLSNAIPKVSFLIPEITAESLRKYGNGPIWSNNAALVVKLMPWIALQDKKLRTIFNILHLTGKGLEQEFFNVTSASWLIIEPNRKN